MVMMVKGLTQYIFRTIKAWGLIGILGQVVVK